MGGPMVCVPCNSPLKWRPTEASGLDPQIEAVAEEQHQRDLKRYPPVRTPWLSRWAGLGYGQGQLGTTLLLMARHDKPDGMQRVLAPMVSARFMSAARLVA